ncbi:MAG: beta-lactamase family protein [Flavobacteriaceae bacterium]|nr:beta-lactamase family protein [Flavobacteriaceae bacterium]
MVSINDSIKIFYSGGYSNFDKKLINNYSTLFYIGSTSKQFTSTALIKLEQEGKLNLNDPITTTLKDVPIDKKQITYHQLLTHTSGLGTYHEIENQGGMFEDISKEEALKRIWNQDLKFKPGSDFAYSNSGYVLLAIVVEEINGESFIDFIREQLLKPNEMNHTGFSGEQNWPENQVATGYGFDGNYHPYEYPILSWTIRGSGGMLTSIRDYDKWITYLLDSPYKDELFTGYVDYPLTKKNAKYGYGWIIEESKEVDKIIYHNGGDTSTGGIATIRIYPKYNAFLIMLANDFNYEPHNLFKVRKDIENELFNYLNNSKI